MHTPNATVVAVPLVDALSVDLAKIVLFSNMAPLSDQGLIYLCRTAKEAAGVVRTINPPTASEVSKRLGFLSPVKALFGSRRGPYAYSERR